MLWGADSRKKKFNRWGLTDLRDGRFGVVSTLDQVLGRTNSLYSSDMLELALAVWKALLLHPTEHFSIWEGEKISYKSRSVQGLGSSPNLAKSSSVVCNMAIFSVLSENSLIAVQQRLRFY